MDDFLVWAKLKNANVWAYCFEGELPLHDAVKSNVWISVIVKVSEAASRAAGVPPSTECASLPVSIPI